MLYTMSYCDTPGYNGTWLFRMLTVYFVQNNETVSILFVKGAECQNIWYNMKGVLMSTNRIDYNKNDK